MFSQTSLVVRSCCGELELDAFLPVAIPCSTVIQLWLIASVSQSDARRNPKQSLGIMLDSTEIMVWITGFKSLCDEYDFRIYLESPPETIEEAPAFLVAENHRRSFLIQV